MGPKRPQSSYMLWLNDTREEIKTEFPGIAITELTKKAGEMWKKVTDRSIWEAKAAKAKEAYEVAMKEYNASGGASSAAPKEKKTKSAKVAKTSPPKSASKSSPSKPGDFKSNEYISTDESSSDGESKKRKKTRKEGQEGEGRSEKGKE